MASLKKLASIPSLTQLYRKGIISPSTQPDLPVGNKVLTEKICTIQYDITKLEVDAIVNAANSRLLGGGGVDGAIHRAAGPGLYRECKKLDGCDTGSAKITEAYNLPCKKVIHAVGPVYHDREESEPLLRSCYRTALQLAAQNDCKSIAFSAISTGIYGYPSDEAAEAVLDEVRTFLDKNEDGSKIEKVIFVNFMQKDVDAYKETLPKVFPPGEEGTEESNEATIEAKESSEETTKDQKDTPSKEETAEAPAKSTTAGTASSPLLENSEANVAVISVDMQSQLLPLKEGDIENTSGGTAAANGQEEDSAKADEQHDTSQLGTRLEDLMKENNPVPDPESKDCVVEAVKDTSALDSQRNVSTQPPG